MIITINFDIAVPVIRNIISIIQRRIVLLLLAFFHLSVDMFVYFRLVWVEITFCDSNTHGGYHQWRRICPPFANT